jgi:hypothetical protein
VKTLEKIKLTDFDARRFEFASAKTFKDACQIAWPEYPIYHPYYQHYTFLDSVVTKILKQEWWLTRSDSVRLNDLQEAKKFGNSQLLKRTYQASFSKGTAESAAMWGLYVRDNPFAVRILIPGKAIEEWMSDVSLCDNVKCANNKIEAAKFQDLIYAAVPFLHGQRDSLDKKRGNSVSWEGMNCNFKGADDRQSKIEGDKLVRDLHEDEVTGFVKDYEWRHEREARLCVQLRKASSRKAIPIKIPLGVIASMSFTMSPWVDPKHEKHIRKSIQCALDVIRMSAKEEPKIKFNSQPFRRSVLQGAFNLR